MQVTRDDYPENFSAPAVTVCSKNRIFRQRFCKAYPDDCGGQNVTWDEFCNKYKKQCDSDKPPDFNFGMLHNPSIDLSDRSSEFLDEVGPPEFSNVLAMCYTIINGKFVDRSDSILIQASEAGFPYRCFSVLSLLGKPNEESVELTIKDSYFIVLGMYPEEYTNPRDSVQSSVAFHDPRKLVNPMAEGVTISAGKNYVVYPTMERRESLPPPYATKCTDYLKEWKKNGGYGPLSRKDCTDMCKIKAMTDEFGCVQQAITYPNNYTICSDETEDTTGEQNRICATNCQDACEENIYHLTVKSAAFSTPCQDPTDEFCENTDVTMTVLFTHMKVQNVQHIPKFESIELFGYIGGYLGMWLGISLASVFDLSEMIYDVIVNAFLKRKRNRKTAMPIRPYFHQTV